MKKFFIILLALCLSLCLFGCGDKEESDTAPLPDLEGYEGPFPEEQKPQIIEEEEEERPHLPLPPEDADFYRGTWISGGEGNINDTLDHYYDINLNYMTLSPDGTGALVLGGEYMEILYKLDGNTLQFTLSQTGDRFLGSVLSPVITEINYMNSGKLMTFIKIEPQDVEKVIVDLHLGE